MWLLLMSILILMGKEAVWHTLPFFILCKITIHSFWRPLLCFAFVMQPFLTPGSGSTHGFTHGDSRPRQNGRHFADHSFKYIFLNENFRISNEISLRFVPKGPINNVPALIRIMAWRRPGDKPLSEPIIVRSVTHICVARSQWVKFMWENVFL